MMPEQDAIDRRNSREIDRLGLAWLESVKAAAGKDPFGEATCTFKWQHHAVIRVVTNEEKSQVLEIKLQP
jgi:hypothetical protein